MFTALKGLAKRSRTAVIAFNLYNNWRARGRFEPGNKESGLTPSGIIFKTVDERLAYIDSVFADYLEYSGLNAGELSGKRILEIGPGNDLGVALRMLAAGAQQVICLDKYPLRCPPQEELEIYRALRERLDNRSRHNFDAAVSLGRKPELQPAKLQYIEGVGLEEADQIFAPRVFDLIVSRAVVEYLETESAFAVMDRLLAPGGRMIHKIDFRDDGLFSSGGLDPLTFLTVSDSLYSLMTSHSAKPNRRLINYYREKMAALGYDARLLVTRVFGEGSELARAREKLVSGIDYRPSTLERLEAIRPKLDRKWRDLPAEDLLAAGIFLVAQKPVEAQIERNVRAAAPANRQVNYSWL